MFELYKRTRATTDEESVSINSTGVISLSPVVTEKYLKDKTYVELYFDSSSKKIGIKPIKQKTEYSLQVVRPAHSRRATVSGRGFLSSNKVDFTKRRDCPVTFDDNMIIFSIK